ncbi:MAG: ATP-binding protein [Candidatus Omnitrophica bacterium]|nr:ATP-binding protein [Candidatus Omnitrophota bacterium]
MRWKTRLEHSINRKIGKAIRDFNLIEDGDRILIALSGGKDSLTLLSLLAARRSFAPVKFDLHAALIESDWLPFLSKPRKKIEKLLKILGIPYTFEEISLGNRKETKNDKNCFWCSWSRRKALFELAGRLGFNKIALGHTKDDAIETTLLNLFFQGTVGTMLPNQEFFKGKLRIIRPLVYVEEKETARYAKEAGLQSPTRPCPIAKKSNRPLMKLIIKQAGRVSPHVKDNILQALLKTPL